MSEIHVDIDYVELENDTGLIIDSVSATCSRCERVTESFGTGPRSVRRCLALLREGCEGGHFYVADEGADDDE